MTAIRVLAHNPCRSVAQSHANPLLDFQETAAAEQPVDVESFVLELRIRILLPTPLLISQMKPKILLEIPGKLLLW